MKLSVQSYGVILEALDDQMDKVGTDVRLTPQQRNATNKRIEEAIQEIETIGTY